MAAMMVVLKVDYLVDERVVRMVVNLAALMVESMAVQMVEKLVDMKTV